MLTPDTHTRQEQGPRPPVARGGFLPRRLRCGGWTLYLKLRPARPQLPPRRVRLRGHQAERLHLLGRLLPPLEVTVEVQLAEEDEIITRWTARGTHSGELLGPSVTACSFSGSHRVQEDQWAREAILGLFCNAEAQGQRPAGRPRGYPHRAVATRRHTRETRSPNPRGGL
jgi:hypothetical protein